MSDTFRPIVAVPCRYNWNTNYHEVRETYPEAIYAAGGTPVMLPLIPEPEYINAIMEKVDAVCLTGSINDVDPLRYGQEPKPKLGGRPHSWIASLSTSHAAQSRSAEAR